MKNSHLTLFSLLTDLFLYAIFGGAFMHGIYNKNISYIAVSMIGIILMFLNRDARIKK